MNNTSTRPIVVLSLATLLVVWGASVFTAAQGTSAPRAAAAAPATADAQAHLATIKQYCAGCHSDRIKAGGVSFEGLTPDQIGQHPDVFE